MCVKIQTHCSGSEQPKCSMKMVSLMLPLSSALLLRRKRKLVQTNIIPWTTEGHKLFKKIWIRASSHHNQHRRRRGNNQKISNGRVYGSFCNRSEHWLNTELETNKTVVVFCPISFVFSTSSALHCKTRDFPDLQQTQTNSCSGAFSRLVHVSGTRACRTF